MAKRNSWAAPPEGDGFDVEPIYGKFYMPRKFKMAIGYTFDNCVDVYANDLGLIAVTEGDNIVGYNIVAGGGMGVTPSAEEKHSPPWPSGSATSSPARPCRRLKRSSRSSAITAIAKTAELARLKYVIANWGIEKFKAKVEEYYGGPLADFRRESDVQGFNDHMGWDEQGDGRWFYGLNIENSHYQRHAEMQLKTALREACRTLNPSIRLTAHQSLIFGDIQPADRPKLESILRSHGVKLTEEISHRPPLEHGLRGLAHLRAVDHRKRTGSARLDRSESRPSWLAWVSRRKNSRSA